MRKYINLRANIALGFIFAFLANTFGPLPAAQADDFRLPAPGVMVRLSPDFNPPILKGIKVHPDNPFRFDFILDHGDEYNRHPERSEGSQQEQLKIESTKLIKYFLASLTIPEKDLWVNLSPYEKDRIVPASFGQTEMGRDLLAEDYMLKQITASLIYPEGEVGKEFWKRIYAEAAKKFGTTNIPVNTFNKVWIVPEKAVVYENAKAGTAYIVESKLKVMLEQDYLALSKNKRRPNDFSSQVIREIVIPQLTKEVNEGKNFIQLRQVYNSLILAVWYKRKIKESILSRIYNDKDKIFGVNIDDPRENQKIYQLYLQAFKKGVYNYIKEEQDPMTQQTILRKYFSGGITDLATKVTIEQVPIEQLEDVMSAGSTNSLIETVDMALTSVQIIDHENVVGNKDSVWEQIQAISLAVETENHHPIAERKLMEDSLNQVDPHLKYALAVEPGQNEIIGYIFYRVQKGNVIYVSNIAVLPAYRRSSVGFQLMQRVFQFADSVGSQRVNFCTSSGSGNSTLSFNEYLSKHVPGFIMKKEVFPDLTWFDFIREAQVVSSSKAMTAEVNEEEEFASILIGAVKNKKIPNTLDWEIVEVSKYILGKDWWDKPGNIDEHLYRNTWRFLRRAHMLEPAVEGVSNGQWAVKKKYLTFEPEQMRSYISDQRQKIIRRSIQASANEPISTEEDFALALYKALKAGVLPDLRWREVEEKETDIEPFWQDLPGIISEPLYLRSLVLLKQADLVQNEGGISEEDALGAVKKAWRQVLDAGEKLMMQGQGEDVRKEVEGIMGSLIAARKSGERVKVPKGFWQSKENAREAIWLALDKISGFKKARLEADIPEMARLIREKVINYQVQIVQQGGAAGYFKEEGGLSGLMVSHVPFLDATNSPAALLRFALPGLVDEDALGALRPWELENTRRDDYRLIKKAMIQGLDNIRGFQEARLRGIEGVAEMARLFRKAVIDKPKGQEGYFNNDVALRWAIGKGKVIDAMRLALPQLIDEDAPGALRPWELEEAWDNQRWAKKAILQALDKITDSKGTFKDARLKGKDGVAEMARLYREHVKTYRSKEGRKDGQQAYFIEEGGVGGLMNLNHPFLSKLSSPAALLQFALPELVDQNDSNALRSDEIERDHKNRSVFVVDKEKVRGTRVKNIHKILQWLDGIGTLSPEFNLNWVKRFVSQDVIREMDDPQLEALQNHVIAEMPKFSIHKVIVPDPILQAARALEEDQAAGAQFSRNRNGKTEEIGTYHALPNKAMAAKGGIDLTQANIHFPSQNNNGEIKFHLDLAMLRQLQNAPGFVPVIINIQPMNNLREFLGLNDPLTLKSNNV